jgi:hypothetical protein
VGGLCLKGLLQRGWLAPSSFVSLQEHAMGVDVTGVFGHANDNYESCNLIVSGKYQVSWWIKKYSVEKGTSGVVAHKQRSHHNSA